ncbi:MAG TPA: metalloregulator ArsR/SmtB family transcription factor [Steroidobacteraceae bacterium]|nr:metalloregulator ArsR/SmtB family transcription factor [Steroidobacteraceae bacterium]HNS27478.1 metalloregulator ArsR/SmtB family transcription factor [Steroidobacteraceae bacterium]
MAAHDTSPKRRAGSKMAADDMRAHAGDAAALLRPLANEQRLAILCCLLGGAQSVSQINAKVALSQSALSQHLAVLREAGIVETSREAQAVYYSLAPGPARRVLAVMHDIFCAR